MLSEFSIRNIGDIDGGRIAAMIDESMRKCAADVCDGPADDRARKTTIEISQVPVVDRNSAAVRSEIEVVVKTSLPSIRSSKIDMSANGAGVLRFNAASPDNVRQGTLDDAMPDEGGDR